MGVVVDAFAAFAFDDFALTGPMSSGQLCSAHLVCHHFKCDCQGMGGQGLKENGGVILRRRIVRCAQALKDVV